MKAEAIIDHLARIGSQEKAAEMARYHKVDRVYLGVANPVLNDIAKDLRRDMSIGSKVGLASSLWKSNLHEARILAAKILTQARMRPDDEAAWATIKNWTADFDAWAIADHACIAGQKRLVANPSRLDEVEQWTTSDHMWTRRAALVSTLPWTKQNHPKPEDLAARDRILGWAARLCGRHRLVYPESGGVVAS